MYTDRHYQSRLNRRKLSLNTITNRDLRSVPIQRDPYPSLSSDCPGPGPGPVGMMVIKGNGEDEFHRGKRRYIYNHTRKLCSSTSSRPRVLLCPYKYYFAIIFLLAAGLPSMSMSIVRAQTQPSFESTTAPLPTNAPVTTATTAVPATIPESVPDLEPELVPVIVIVEPVDLPPTPSSMDDSLIKNTTAPTTSPTESLTRTMTPSSKPSNAPSPVPSVSMSPTEPSSAPSSQPTWTEASTKKTKFRQEFMVGNGKEFNADEIIIFESLYRTYTLQFAPVPDSEVITKIDTTCTVDRQEILLIRDRRLLRSNLNEKESWLIEQKSGNISISSNVTSQLRRRRRQRRVQDTANPQTSYLSVDFTMSFESKYHNVMTYPRLFQNWTNSNLEQVLDQMKTLSINVTEVDKAQRIIVSTPVPSMSLAPSMPPTVSPTTTPGPTLGPIEGATDIPSSTLPTSMPTPEQSEVKSLIIIAVSIIIAFSIIAAGLFICYKKRRDTREMELQAIITKNKQGHGESEAHSETRWAGTSGISGAAPSLRDSNAVESSEILCEA